ncbi:TIGR03862 family flavoprotein [Cellvibrio sp. QJXJ]|uniref:TIGR03862 family flavoprotein n=1 Tax=Cellvibrio sp. QJXJ TaxID=2964606 RepID=UPI0021C2A978|nr:TIGR03862 family flavoprotein [Cellvibrio sp. QJXJ]UUA72200.1 TIGR03862 family flavoprotein [Cellvibrio sp. QJXJ]
MKQFDIFDIPPTKSVAIIGGGPAGLMAAEVIASAGHAVSVYDAMPSVGRKFLLAGVGGMNITHAEPAEDFRARYSASAQFINSLKQFDADALRQWVHGLGVDTFVGTSGRVFPTDMKAAPLLRAWLHRLRELGVKIYPRHRWLGWSEQGDLNFSAQENGNAITKTINADALVLALGGASWQRLGSNGAWVPLLRERSVQVNELVPSNCGFDVIWSEFLINQHAGAPLQGVGLSCVDAQGMPRQILSEAIISAYGIEGTGIYALSKYLRENLAENGSALLNIDLLPDFSPEKIVQKLNKPREKNSLSNFLRKQFNLSPVKLALLRELTSKQTFENPALLAMAIKKLSVTLTATRPIDEAISSAGGVAAKELDASYMLKKIPGVFCAGEMLDWDAPTGGYLLTGCFASGRAAGNGVVSYLRAAHVR